MVFFCWGQAQAKNLGQSPPLRSCFSPLFQTVSFWTERGKGTSDRAGLDCRVSRSDGWAVLTPARAIDGQITLKVPLGRSLGPRALLQARIFGTNGTPMSGPIREVLTAPRLRLLFCPPPGGGDSRLILPFGRAHLMALLRGPVEFFFLFTNSVVTLQTPPPMISSGDEYRSQTTICGEWE